MAKHIFGISINLPIIKKSIEEISKDIYQILLSLSNTDELFTTPYLRSESFNDVVIRLNQSKENEIKTIAEAILSFSGPDIKKYEKVENVNFSYSRDIGFSVVLEYRHKNETISFLVKLGSVSANGINTLSYQGKKLSISRGEKVLKTLIDSSSTLLGSLKITDTNFLKLSKIYKYPLGLITYFSNDYELKIPDDLIGLEYEYTNKGKYLILTREDFTADTETFQHYKNKLLNIMEEIKNRVPEF